VTVTLPPDVSEGSIERAIAGVVGAGNVLTAEADRLEPAPGAIPNAIV
jgi:hypothetical protein